MNLKPRGAAASLAALALVLCVLPLKACDSDVDARQSLVLQFSGLEPLAGGFHYEGWAIIGGQPVSTGKFNVNPSGSLVTLNGTVIGGGLFEVDRDLSAATTVVITIEPAGDTDAVPAATKILAGSLASRQGSLRISHADALGTDFASAGGVYLLATPTDGPGSNETSGIWFIDPSSGTPMPGLTLPALPAGWRFEGWTVFNGGSTPVTTGPFTSASTVDLAAPFSGAMPGPPFPGEDYLMNAPAGLTFPTDLSGLTAVITVEPFPDDSPEPFTLHPLSGQIPAPAAPMTPYALTQNTASFPSGSARIE
jgi:hypothetical protein